MRKELTGAEENCLMTRFMLCTPLLLGVVRSVSVLVLESSIYQTATFLIPGNWNLYRHCSEVVEYHDLYFSSHIISSVINKEG